MVNNMELAANEAERPGTSAGCLPMAACFNAPWQLADQVQRLCYLPGHAKYVDDCTTYELTAFFFFRMTRQG